jgi:GT2 family glycosyltransferase
MKSNDTAGAGSERVAARKPVLADISVAIPTLGRPILQRAISALFDGDAWPAEVIVVHQGDDPAVERWLDGYRDRGLVVRYIRSSERGRARGVNRGLEAAATPYVAITDDDCLAAPDWVVRMAEEIRATPDFIITGRVDAEGDELPVAVNTTPEAWTRYRPVITHDVLCGGNMVIARATIARTGPFDEDPRVATAEDCEFSYRALSAGVPIRYVPTAAVSHVGWRPLDGRRAQYRSYARSHGGFYGKYLRERDAFIAIRVGIHHYKAVRRWILGTIFRDADQAASGYAYLTGLLPGIIRGLRGNGPGVVRPEG